MADNVGGAEAYEFRFTPQPEGSGPAVTAKRTSYSFSFGASTPLAVGTTYKVEARAIIQGIAGDFVYTGCEITIAGPPMMDQESMTSNEEAKAGDLQETSDYSLFPNPNDGTEFKVQRLESSFSEGSIGIEISDITGKLLHSELKALKGDSRLLVDPSTDLSKGMYLLRITDEKGTQTLRLTVD